MTKKYFLLQIMSVILFITVGNTSLAIDMQEANQETIDGIVVGSFTLGKEPKEEDYNKKKAHQDAESFAKISFKEINDLFDIDEEKITGGYFGGIVRAKDRKFVFLYINMGVTLKNGEKINIYKSSFMGKTKKNTNEYFVVCASDEEMKPLTGACLKKVEEVFDIKRKDMIME
ncbi:MULTISPECIES: hypothetical protein [Pasteurellaceae]|uniref:DUF4410 domain-containing protein n=2 Tax=Pasteurellaceae TaxID=712 RepID=A0AAW8CM72_9PAST|nr:hypothetical protein [Pasteurella atlantica]MBR0573673.1 hypothetical protein [Pasteurella atlantica]MDP8039428.1 hypothetical protein [Pasteurella atlantica]MDP8041520.1 hypothetical protein [Pasteurella atlantica]MDP8043555.1 hypothetical protein [Pasteurella atlantica]MDP8045741.1 hypothetical protein [Pasteurella atlantica]